MFMRHFGHGVGHLQYDRQHEIEFERDTTTGQMLEDVSDSGHSGNLEPGDSESEADEHEVGDDNPVGLDEEEEEEEGPGGDAASNLEDDMIVSDSDSDAADSDDASNSSNGYASY
jgi:hypothetical protein